MRAAVFVVAALALAAGALSAQDTRRVASERAPRFVRMSPTPGGKPIDVDTTDVPVLRRRIALSLRSVTRSAALDEIGLASAIQFVYAGDILPPRGTVSVRSDAISVAAALVTVLDGAGVDVAIGVNGNLILVRKPPLPLVTQGTPCTVPAAGEEPLPLCLDGNGMSELSGFVRLAGNDASVGFAISGIAATAGVKVELEPDVLALRGAANIPTGTFPVAEALLRVASGRPVAIYVTSDRTLSVRGIAQGYALAAVTTYGALEARQVFESQAAMGHLELRTKDLNAAPAFFQNDVLRSVALLPGVETRNDYSAGLNVRGGESDQNLILLDGYPIYNPFHMGGLFGTFIDPMVGKVDLLTGAAPVRYGERLSSVLDVQSAEESRHGLHGSADVSLLAASASVGSAFDGGGSWMIGGRHTYADVIANLFRRNSLPYGFSDLQAHLTRPVFGDAVLSLTGYLGSDGTSISQNDGGLDISWGNKLIGATISRTVPRRTRVLGVLWADSLALAQRVSLTTFDATALTAARFFNLRSSVSDVRASGSATLFGEVLTHSLGYEISREQVRYSLQSPLSSVTNFLPRAAFDQALTPVSAWYDALWHASKALMVDAGVRVDAVGGAGWTGVSPRVSVKYFLSDVLALTAATGSYAQWLHSLAQEDAPVQPLEFWIASSNTLPVSRAWQSSVGLERWVGPGRQLRVEGFYKKYSNLMETNPATDPSKGDNPLVALGGTSYGADVLLRQLDNGSFGGWIAYSYAVSDRVTPSGEHFWPGQDRRHELNAVGTWRRDRYRFSARLAFSTGTPYTPVVGEFQRLRYDPLGNAYKPDVNGSDTQYLSGAPNSARMPFAHRLDLSVSRTGTGNRVQVSPYLSLANAYGANNPAFYIFDYGTSTTTGRAAAVPAPERDTFPGIPFLPTIGVRIVF